MGRGRAKAKQTKVARELKYFSPDTDLSALQRELTGSTAGPPNERKEYDDPYRDPHDLADDYSEYDDEPGSRRRTAG